MRLAFTFMLVLNVAFFIWQTSLSDKSSLDASMQVPKEDGRYKTITLLHETGEYSNKKNDKLIQEVLSISARVGEAAAKKADLENNEIIQCYLLETFKNKSDANRALRRAKKAGAIVSIHSKEIKERFRYWVLDPATSKKAALRKVKKYEEKGVEDVYMIREGKKKDDISLGIFRARSTAQKRIEELSILGFDPIVEKHYRIKTHYWLDVRETLQKPLSNATWSRIIGGVSGVEKSDEGC